MKILVSACLLGMNCKYDGSNNRNEKVIALMESNELIPVCPECLGHLPTPRVPSEIVGGIVTNAEGHIVDKEFRDGARGALGIAREREIDCAILQSRSPSCGVRQVYDGTFSRTLKDGKGIFAQMLADDGFRVLDVEEFCASPGSIDEKR